MYSIIKKTILFSSFTILAITACKKEEETVKPVEAAPVPTPTATNSFTWSENGGATITADSAYF